MIAGPEWVNPLALFVIKDNLKLNLDLHYAVALFDITINQCDLLVWYIFNQ